MQAKTHLKTNTVTPFWDQAFTLDNLPADCSHVVVQLYRFAYVFARHPNRRQRWRHSAPLALQDSGKCAYLLDTNPHCALLKQFTHVVGIHSFPHSLPGCATPKPDAALVTHTD